MGIRVLDDRVALKKPHAVVFDLDNTIYAYAPAHAAGFEAVSTQLKKDFKLSDDAINDFYTMARDTVKVQLGATASSHSRLLYFQVMLEQMGMKSQPMMALSLEALYWRHFFMAMQCFDGVKVFLETVRQANIPTAVVTDLTAQIQFRKLIHLDLESAFDWVITSEEAGEDKKGNKPFICLASKLKVPETATIWMIGDAPVDANIQKIFPNALIFSPCGHQKAFKGAQLGFKSYQELVQLFKKQDVLQAQAVL